ncbi:exopolyphosphatase [uncultured Jatrophihabitans sp.]|uniref:Ppx/GppA phosphatase family protein n=1 Tax=uncultured Jatrophihabitans sp. TaxID=1610747 RepID=UPI0035CBE712
MSGAAAGHPDRVAAIDCGTNSIRLLVADLVDGGRVDGGLVDVVREMRVVRLGQDVDRTGRLAPEAIERTRVALAGYAAQIRDLGAQRVRMVATSATRDAANRDEFRAMVRAELGAEPEVITGQEEAALSFTGAASVLPQASGPLLVTDIGGGSTELVRGELRDLAALRAHSMDVGCVRLTERHLADDPPTGAQIAAAERDVRSALERARADVPLDADVPFVGVAGTVTTVAAIALGLGAYDPDVINGSVVAAGQVRAVTERLLGMTRQQRAALAVMHPGRVDVIGAGALVLRTLVDEIGVSEVIVSEHDILDGLALSFR